MNRRKFLKDGGLFAFAAARMRPCLRLIPKAISGQAEDAVPNTDWADPNLGAKASSSTFVADPPWGYSPDNLFGDNLFNGWQANAETSGAWIQIDFGQL